MDANLMNDPIQALLGRFDNADPQLKQLLENQLRNNLNKKSDEIPPEEIIKRCRVQNRKLWEQVTALKEELKRSADQQNKITAYLDYFLKLNKTLSSALGSCENCWGEDSACETCLGDGIPGWKPVNKRLFNIYIQPCIEKVFNITGNGNIHPNGNGSIK